MKSKLLAILLFLVAGQLKAQEEFKKEHLIGAGDTLNYRILYPQKMRAGKKYPLVLFLHGSGERGSDNEKQLTHGAKLFLNTKNQKKYPAVVVFPQCPENQMWSRREKEQSGSGKWIFRFPLGPEPTEPARLVNQLVEELSRKDYIDVDRIYMMGLSMGGIGALEFLYRWPDKYAAAVVICGGHNPQLASTYCHVPVWFFHGGKDDVVPPENSRAVFNELRRCNPDSKYTLYPDANHNSWDPAFSEPDLLQWIFSKRNRTKLRN